MRNAFVRGLKHLHLDIRKYLLAMLAMTASTAVLFATFICAKVTNERLAEGVDSLGGIADVGLIPETPGDLIPADALTVVEKLSGIRSTIPTYSSSTVVTSDSGNRISLTLTGYPAHFNRTLLFQKLEGSLPKADSPEVMLPADIAQSLGVHVGSTVSVLGADGLHKLSVVGIIDPSELGMLAYENIFVDLITAQKIFDENNKFTRIDLQVISDPSGWTLANADKLPSGITIQDTKAVTASFGPVLRAVSMVLQIISIAALAITLLLTATAFSSVIRARRISYSLLRTIGASKSWITQGLLAEAVLLGVISGLAGVVFGPLAALGLIQIMPGRGGFPEQGTLVWQGILSIAICVVASLLGCLFSLRSLYKGSALVALGTSTQGASPKVRKILGLVGVGGVLLSIILLLVSDANICYAFAFVLLLTSAALLAPSAVALLAGTLRNSRWVLAYASRRLHSDRQMLAPAAIIAIIMAMSAALLTVANSIGESMNRQVASQFGADIQITSKVPIKTTNPGGVSALQGVEFIAPIAPLKVVIGSTSSSDTKMDVNAISIEPDSYFATADLAFIKSNANVHDQIKSGSIAIPESVAKLLNVDVGDEINISYAGRSFSAPVAGIFVSMATGTQIIIPNSLVGNSNELKYDMWYVSISNDRSPKDMRDAVEEAISLDIPGASVITGAEMRDRAISDLRTYTIAVFALVGITLFVGSIGVAGIFALSVLRRRRELATLRIVGFPANRIGILILSEVILVGLPATVSGIVIGSGAGWTLSQILSRAMGISAIYRPDLLSFFTLALLSITSLSIAGYWPVRNARTSTPNEALRAE